MSVHYSLIKAENKYFGVNSGILEKEDKSQKISEAYKSRSLPSRQRHGMFSGLIFSAHRKILTYSLKNNSTTFSFTEGLRRLDVDVRTRCWSPRMGEMRGPWTHDLTLPSSSDQ